MAILAAAAILVFVTLNIEYEVVHATYFAADFRAPIYDTSKAMTSGANPYLPPGTDFHTVAAVVLVPIALAVVAPLTFSRRAPRSPSGS